LHRYTKDHTVASMRDVKFNDFAILEKKNDVYAIKYRLVGRCMLNR
jgi:hypothetical protein